VASGQATPDDGTVSTPAPTLALLNGAHIPQLGLGTWPMDDATAERVVRTAVERGYRLVDTAENYQNERGVGLGLRTSGVPREKLFVTTKFNKQWHSVDGVRRACEASLERLGLDYVDLLLIHWPNPAQDRYVEAYRGLLALLHDGLVRAVGTSNFTSAHLQRVLDETGVPPDVNQLQLNPYVVQEEGRAFAAQHGIVVQSWSPLGRGPELRCQPVVAELAQRYGRTPAQILLRWHIQLGLVPVPKSEDPQRLRENIAVFDFELTTDDVERVSRLDRGGELAVDPEAFGH
jgi:2,5-diketo-D-gluconate reductase A